MIETAALYMFRKNTCETVHTSGTHSRVSICRTFMHHFEDPKRLSINKKSDIKILKFTSNVFLDWRKQFHALEQIKAQRKPAKFLE